MRNRFILVADTSDTFLHLLAEELATTDYSLLHAKDGQKAIDYLELLESKIELVIVEMELPVVSGLDVIWWLVRRKQPKLPRIIATSAVKDPLLKRVVKELGVDAVVQIPIPAEDWGKLVAKALSGELNGGSLDTSAQNRDRKDPKTFLREAHNATLHKRLGQKTIASQSINWLQILLFCEPCQTAAQIVTLAVCSDETILLRCICPRCGNKVQDDFSMEELVSLGESSGHAFKASPLPRIPARKCN